MDEQYRIIKRLDSPPMFVTIKLSDLWLCALPTTAMLAITSSILCSLVTLGLMMALQRASKRLPRFYFKRLLYWYLPDRVFSVLFGVRFAPSYVHRWMRR